MADDRQGAGRVKRGEASEAEPILRRDLGAVLAAAGFMAACSTSADANEPDAEQLGQVVQNASAMSTLAWADTIGFDLATYNSLQMGGAMIVVVRGRVAAGDGGAGIFYWEKDSARPADGILVVAPSSGGGRWVRAASGPVNVTWFGAVGDGVVDATATLQAAVRAVVTLAGALAGATGASPQLQPTPELFWPLGVYKTSSSIPDLHRVRHRGPGVIARAGHYFHVAPRQGQRNTVFLRDANGNASNDGLSPGEPLDNIQSTFDVLTNYGPVLDGNWYIDVRGTFRNAISANHFTPSREPVVVLGPGDIDASPATPTEAVFDGTYAGQGQYAWRCSGPGTQMEVRNIKFTSYTGYTGAGLLADRACETFLIRNVHCHYCDVGVYVENVRDFRAIGGQQMSNRVGFLLNVVSYAGLGYDAQNLLERGRDPLCYFNRCTTGIEWSRGTEGHADYCRFDDCGVALDIFHNARSHVMACNFVRNGVAVRARTGGYYYLEQNAALLNNFHVNDPGFENTVNWQNRAYSGESDADLWASSCERRVYSKALGSHTQTTTKAEWLVAPYVIPAGFFIDETKKIVVRLFGEFPIAAGSAVGVDFYRNSTTAPVDLAATDKDAPNSKTPFEYELTIIPNGYNAQRAFGKLCVHSLAPIVTKNELTADMRYATQLKITAKLASAAQTLTIHWAEVFVTG